MSSPVQRTPFELAELLEGQALPIGLGEAERCHAHGAVLPWTMGG